MALTPMMQQHGLEGKACGLHTAFPSGRDEMFFEDAQIAARELDISDRPRLRAE